jgi:molecular chaperone DnaK
MTSVVAIDLGTTTSAVALARDGEPVVLATSEGKRIPSVVAFNRSGEQLIGKAAKRQAAINPENTIFSIKRFLGRRAGDLETEEERARVPYQIVAGAEDDVRVLIPHTGREVPVQEVAACILRRLKQEAETYLGEPVQQAVLTVPAYFNDSQRQAVKDAGRIAGLDVLRIINEPTAAALSYGRHRDQDETILVVDLGGGTYDVSVLEISNGLVTVKANHGDTFLGGEDWDAAIADWLIGKFLRQHGIDLRKDRHAMQRVREAAERAKIELSTAEKTTVYLPFVITGASGPHHLRATLTRKKFELLTAPLVDRMVAPLQKALQDAQVTAEQLDAVLLVGGGSQIPSVRARLQTLTGHEPSAAVDPEEVVVLGAALQAAMLAGKWQEMQLQEVTSLSLGLETMGGLMTTLIPRNTPIPARRTEVFSTTEDDQTSVEIHVLQGERHMAADNTKLGIALLDGIPPAPRGVPQIEVTFEIDADGILHVSARDAATGSSQALVISSVARLSDGEVEAMVREAEEYLYEDEERRALVEARNVAQQIIYQTERSLQHLNGHVIEGACLEKRKEIIRKLATLRVVVLGQDPEEIRRHTAGLQRANLVLGRLAYEKGEEGPGGVYREWADNFNDTQDAFDITIETI